MRDVRITIGLFMIAAIVGGMAFGYRSCGRLEHGTEARSAKRFSNIVFHDGSGYTEPATYETCMAQRDHMILRIVNQQEAFLDQADRIAWLHEQLKAADMTGMECRPMRVTDRDPVVGHGPGGEPIAVIW